MQGARRSVGSPGVVNLISRFVETFRKSSSYPRTTRNLEASHTLTGTLGTGPPMRHHGHVWCGFHPLVWPHASAVVQLSRMYARRTPVLSKAKKKGVFGTLLARFAT